LDIDLLGCELEDIIHASGKLVSKIAVLLKNSTSIRRSEEPLQALILSLNPFRALKLVVNVDKLKRPKN
jgi:GTP-binding protein LepA